MKKDKLFFFILLNYFPFYSNRKLSSCHFY